jgi:hypothetical protein
MISARRRLAPRVLAVARAIQLGLVPTSNFRHLSPGHPSGASPKGWTYAALPDPDQQRAGIRAHADEARRHAPAQRLARDLATAVTCCVG